MSTLCDTQPDDPNTGPELLLQWSEREPARVLTNPVLPMLALENPSMYKQLVESCHRFAFVGAVRALDWPHRDKFFRTVVRFSLDAMPHIKGQASKELAPLVNFLAVEWAEPPAEAWQDMLHNSAQRRMTSAGLVVIEWLIVVASTLQWLYSEPDRNAVYKQDPWVFLIEGLALFLWEYPWQYPRPAHLQPLSVLTGRDLIETRVALYCQKLAPRVGASTLRTELPALLNVTLPAPPTFLDR